MKKFFLAVALLCAGIVSVQADNDDRPIALDQLPVHAQQFIAAHFKDLQVAYAIRDFSLGGSDYEVVFTDRTEVEFGRNGDWKSIERRHAEVPADIVPAGVQTAIDKLGTSHAFVTKIERNSRTWEVELSNGLELTLDKEFRIIDIDD